MKKKIIAGILVLTTLITPTTALADGGTAPPGPLATTNTITTVTNAVSTVPPNN